MDADEVEIAIDELENRLERLRSLYEQYFLGIEKIEPTVARKDVDRRIWLLRREQIRNTARRFKLQTIVQRYNTFQQYWQRICREIENGTYKRHLLRAERTFGPDKALTIAARKRFRKRGDATDAAAADKALDAQNQLAEDLGAALENKDYDPLEEAKRAVDAALGRADAGRGSQQTDAAPGRERPPPPTPEPARAPSVLPRQQLGRLELDLDDDLLGGSPPPSPASTRLRPAAAVAARAPARAAPPVARARREAPARPGRPPARPSAGARPAPPAGASGPRRPAPPARPAAAARPTAARPAAARPPGPPPRKAGGGAGQAGVSDDRVRELHTRLVTARQQTNDRRNISVNGLKKSLQAAESKLRKQHGNRNIDFDVVIKDGKAVVKPIVR